MITYWIYTKRGVKVGEFSISPEAMVAGVELMGSEEKVIKARYTAACLGLGLNPKTHNKCIAAV